MDARPHQFRSRGHRLFEWITPQVGLDLGYTILASRDRTHGSSDEGRTFACKALQNFHVLAAPSGSEDHIYLMRVRTIALEFANALEHHRRVFVTELEAAEAQYAIARYQIHRSRETELKLETLQKMLELVHISIWGALGYVVAQMVKPFVPTEIANATGTFFPSALMTIVFGIAGGFVREIWHEHRRKRADARHELHWRQVNYTYEQCKINEYHLHRKQLKKLWEDYTGQTCLELPSYESQMESDLRTRKRLDRKLQKLSTPELRNLAQHLAETLRRNGTTK